jgi:acyl-CoA dehydrogenase
MVMHSIRGVDWQRHYPQDLFSHAVWLREHALEIDNEPERPVLDPDHSLVGMLTDCRPLTTTERVKLFEALSYGCPGALLSLPGTGLPGVIVRELGSPQQQQIFFDAVKKNRARTFLAVTEPSKGSDAAGMTTRLDNDGLLYGDKWLVGHAASGDVGVAMVRTGQGPLSLGAVLLTAETLSEPAAVTRGPLPMLGLKGAMLGYMSFAGLNPGKDTLLGAHKHPLERGMLALIRTFSRFRPCVAAMATGHAQAMVDYARVHLSAAEQARGGETLLALDARIGAARRLIALAAAEVDKNPASAPLVSLCKVSATQTCEQTADVVQDLLGPGSLLRHPWLEKAVRDARAFEYMEGTTNIHLQQAGVDLARRCAVRTRTGSAVPTQETGRQRTASLI